MSAVVLQGVYCVMFDVGVPRQVECPRPPPLVARCPSHLDTLTPRYPHTQTHLHTRARDSRPAAPPAADSRMEARTDSVREVPSGKPSPKRMRFGHSHPATSILRPTRPMSPQTTILHTNNHPRGVSERACAQRLNSHRTCQFSVGIPVFGQCSRRSVRFSWRNSQLTLLSACVCRANPCV